MSCSTTNLEDVGSLFYIQGETRGGDTKIEMILSPMWAYHLTLDQEWESQSNILVVLYKWGAAPGSVSILLADAQSSSDDPPVSSRQIITTLQLIMRIYLSGRDGPNTGPNVVY